MRVLITGGGGFLGLHLALLLSKKGFDVTILDIHEPDRSEYPKNCIFVKGDIRNKKLMDHLSSQNDVIIHAAAALPLWKKEEIFKINVAGTKNLLEASFKNKIKHFIYISSTAVYGVPKKHPIYEDDPLVGVGAYGQSKIEAEKLCREFRGNGLLVTIIRPKTFIGTHRLGVFEILFDWVKDGKRIPVIGSGRNRYQLLDVDDLAQATYLIIKKAKEGKAPGKELNTEFNIAAEKFSTVRNDLGALFKFAKSGSRIMSTPAPLVKGTLAFFEKVGLSPLYKWVYDTADKDSYVSLKRLSEVLGWKPRYSNAQALIKSYRWYLNHYKEIKSRPAGVTHTVGWKQGVLGFFKKFL